MLPPPCFTVGMVPGFLQTWRLAFRPKSSILVSSNQRILFLMVWESFRCLLANSKLTVMCLFYEEWLPSGHSTIKAWSVEDAEKVVLLECSPISTEELWSSVRVTIGFLVNSLTKALLPGLLSLAGRPDLGRVLAVPNFLHLRMMEATVFLGTFNAAEMFWYPSPNLCLDTILFLSSTDNYFDLVVFDWQALSTVGPYIDKCLPHVLSIYHRWTPIKL